MNDEQQLHTGAPIHSRIGKARPIAFTILLLAIVGGTYWGISWYNAPLQKLARQEAAVLQDINASKKSIEAQEQALKEEHTHLTELQVKRAEIDAAKIAEANRGVTDTRPISPLPGSPK